MEATVPDRTLANAVRLLERCLRVTLNLAADLRQSVTPEWPGVIALTEAIRDVEKLRIDLQTRTGACGNGA